MASRIKITAGQEVELDRPLIMAVLNATPDSFSDPGAYPDLDSQLRRSEELLQQGADLIDVGGESAVTNRVAISAAEEIERVCPLIEKASNQLGATISVDTYKPEVARSAIEAGAVMVNDVSGLRDIKLAQICAESGAALVLMHTQVEPKVKLENPSYSDVVADVVDFLKDRIEVAKECGVDAEQLIVDPGPDFAKTPAQSIELLHNLDRLQELERPILLAVSRKDFIGALTVRPPLERLAGTLAAVGWGLDHGAAILRVHDVAQVSDFIKVRSALRSGESDQNLALADQLRWQSAIS